MPRTEIPLSKSNMFFSFSACLLFVIMGFYLLITPPDAGTAWQHYAIKGFGVIVILFFGLFGCIGTRKLFDATPALIIDENGITDNTTTAALGFVAWKDIAGIRKYDKTPAEFIVIDLKDPDNYINRQENLKAKWIRIHMEATGSPVAISPNTIQYNFLQLENLIRCGFEDYKNLNP